MMLVSLQEQKEYMRVDHDFEDGKTTSLIKVCSKLVINYLKQPISVFVGSENVDSDGQAVEDSDGVIIGVPDEIKGAVQYWVAYISRDPDYSDTSDKWQLGFPPFPVVSMLYPLRDPAMS